MFKLDKFFVAISRRQFELFVQTVSLGEPTTVVFQPYLVKAAGCATGIYYKDELVPWRCGPIPVRVGDVLKANFNLTKPV